MTAFEVLSKLQAKRMTPEDAWTAAAACVHQSMGWSAVLAHALKAQPQLEQQLYCILMSAYSDDTSMASNIENAFEAMVEWTNRVDPGMRACGLAIWAAQTQVEPFTVANLVERTPMAWRWNMATSLMDSQGTTRPLHATLVHVLWMEQVAKDHSNDHQVDPSIWSGSLSV